jgi:hypothetical protein
LPGQQVDAEIVERLGTAQGAALPVLITLVGRRQVTATEFARTWTSGLREGQGLELRARLIPFLLDPHRPLGAGIELRDLVPLLDVLEAQAKDDAELTRLWRESLVAAVCVQWGTDGEPAWLDLLHARLARLAGDATPAEVRRKAGIFWPLWAAGAAGAAGR